MTGQSGHALEYWNPPQFKSPPDSHILFNKNGVHLIIAKGDLLVKMVLKILCSTVIQRGFSSRWIMIVYAVVVSGLAVKVV